MKSNLPGKRIYYLFRSYSSLYGISLPKALTFSSLNPLQFLKEQILNGEDFCDGRRWYWDQLWEGGYHRGFTLRCAYPDSKTPYLIYEFAAL